MTAPASTPTATIWVLGRIDDVMNMSGHRISTAEVESALVGHSGVAEAAVVGATDETTGQGICAFVILEANAKDNDEHGRRTARAGRQGDLKDRPAARDSRGAGAAEDPQRQDHAPAAA